MRYIVENISGGINDIVNLIDASGNHTDNISDAASLVVRVNNDCFVAVDADAHEIHTVH